MPDIAAAIGIALPPTSAVSIEVVHLDGVHGRAPTFETREADNTITIDGPSHRRRRQAQPPDVNVLTVTFPSIGQRSRDYGVAGYLHRQLDVLLSSPWKKSVR